ncbi:hypothetical protein [Rhizobium sp. LjRoot254]|uniref:hypothetical protein n=1 Tax=Rhizobium sp. LjRoot254 TaxID=3342297 RepID=UPI003ECC9E07
MNNKMNDDRIPPELERYLALCERIYERMVETGEWPWPDSPNFEDVVDSGDNDNGV